MSYLAITLKYISTRSQTRPPACSFTHTHTHAHTHAHAHTHTHTHTHLPWKYLAYGCMLLARIPRPVSQLVPWENREKKGQRNRGAKKDKGYRESKKERRCRERERDIKRERTRDDIEVKKRKGRRDEGGGHVPHIPPRPMADVL